MKLGPVLRTSSLKLSHGAELQPHEIHLLKGIDGKLSIAGFGSLLSERSAKSTFPTLSNFRQAYVPNFRRVFAHTCPIFFERGIARTETGEISSMSTEPFDGSGIPPLLVTVFEVPATEADIAAFVEREHEFRFTAVDPVDREGAASGRLAVMCTRYTDEEYRSIRCKGDASEYHRRFGRHGVDKIYRDDILPCRVYLRHCVLAARRLGPEAEANFLETTFLADRRTTIGEHLRRDPGIMDEEPPESLRGRYSG